MASFCEDTCRVDTSVIIDPGLFLYIHRVYDYVDDDDDDHLMTWMDLSIATPPLPSICDPSYLDLMFACSWETISQAHLVIPAVVRRERKGASTTPATALRFTRFSWQSWKI